MGQFYTVEIVLHFSLSPSSLLLLFHPLLTSCFTTFFETYVHCAWKEEGQDPRVRMAPGCCRAGSIVGLIFRVRLDAFIFSHLEPLVFDVNLAQESPLLSSPLTWPWSRERHFVVILGAKQCWKECRKS